jgi:prepilin-type N-terminal cleavage/methylation domain-containing protein
MRNHPALNRQYGFTMIEVMIALTISAFLLLIIMVMFSSTSSSRALQTSLAGINESGRFSISMLGRDLRMAGYIDNDWFAAAGANSISVDHGAAADGGDTLTVRYEAAKDCLYANSAGGVAVNVYSINTTDFTLECNGEAIVDDVEQMQIYLGQDTDGDGVANRMMAPNDVGLNMAQVVSLRVNLLIRSTNDRRASSTQTYVYDDVSVTATDTRIRRQYSLTVSLRNPII